jgi:hypothetical protein
LRFGSGTTKKRMLTATTEARMSFRIKNGFGISYDILDG